MESSVISPSSNKKLIVWKVVRGTKVFMGVDPWFGSGERFKLPRDRIEHLRIRGINIISQVANLNLIIVWHQEWMNTRDLGIRKDDKIMWGIYIAKLRSSVVHIKDEDDCLVLLLNPSHIYTPKEGYKSLALQEELEFQRRWWWKKSMGLQVPLKFLHFQWLLLKNKVFSWDILQNISIQGPN